MLGGKAASGVSLFVAYGLSFYDNYVPKGELLPTGFVHRGSHKGSVNSREAFTKSLKTIVVNHFLILCKMESCYSSNVLLFWLTWNPDNQLSGSMVWITKTYLIVDLAGTKHRGTDRSLQVQVTSLLISN